MVSVMFKKILLPVFVMLVFSACSNNKAQENALLDSVKNLHDKVMDDDAQLMEKRSQLKMVATQKPELKDSVYYYTKLPDSNDNAMTDWMHKFNPDLTGKSHKEIIDYLTQQEQKITGIDSGMNESVHQSVFFIIKSMSK
jgi:hypothetical protein